MMRVIYTELKIKVKGEQQDIYCAEDHQKTLEERGGSMLRQDI